MSGSEFEHPLIYPTRSNAIFRQIASHLIPALLMPADVDIYDDDLTRARQLVREGNGLIIVGPHFSPRDGFEYLARPLALIPELADKPIVAPITHYQYTDKKQRPVLTTLSKAAGVTLAPIVNRDAVEKYTKMGNTEYENGMGMSQYALLAKEALEQGGAVALTPQAGRRDTLDLQHAKGQALRFLLRAVRANADSPIAFLFLPQSPLEKTDYHAERNNLNITKKYDIRFGPVMTLKEMNGLLEGINGRLKNNTEGLQTRLTLDELSLVIMAAAEDPDYNKIPREYIWEYIIEYFSSFQP